MLHFDLQTFYFIGFGFFFVLNHFSVSGLFRFINPSSFITFPAKLLGSNLVSSKALCFLLILQQVYMYFRGSGKAAEMKREAATRTMMAAL